MKRRVAAVLSAAAVQSAVLSAVAVRSSFVSAIERFAVLSAVAVRFAGAVRFAVTVRSAVAVRSRGSPTVYTPADSRSCRRGALLADRPETHLYPPIEILERFESNLNVSS